ncbi:hypothetical protein C0993_008642 [Termitomyces sp. T159_Od127]|nr:hypothetical protein C0993_008642 [Termitomyces sp. T159_Od127]
MCVTSRFINSRQHSKDLHRRLRHIASLVLKARMVNKQSSTTAELKTQLKNLINSSLGKQLKKILA